MQGSINDLSSIRTLIFLTQMRSGFGLGEGRPLEDRLYHSGIPPFTHEDGLEHVGINTGQFPCCHTLSEEQLFHV